MNIKSDRQIILDMKLADMLVKLQTAINITPAGETRNTLYDIQILLIKVQDDININGIQTYK